MADAKVQYIRIYYYDDERSSDVVAVGGWELVLLQRKYPGDLTGNIEANYYLAYLGAKKAGLVADGMSFDAWGQGVALPEEVEGPGESQAPPAT